MNSNTFAKVVIFIACLTASGLAHAFVGTIAVGLGRMEEIGEIQTSFSGDAVMETEDMTTTTRVYYQPGMVRDEITMGDQAMVTIRRFDLQKVWMLMGQGMYTETAAEESNERAPEYKLISRERIGPETVNGMETTKYKSVYESPDGKFGGFTWFTDDNIAVKGFMVSESKGEKQRIKFEFTSIERGPQADTLFEVPAGYQRFDMSSLAGMRGMMGQPGAAGSPGAPPPGVASPPPGTAGAAEEDSLADVVADEAKQTTEDEIRAESRRNVQDSVRKGFGKIFGR